jgi:ferrous iron transport protein A
LSQAATAPELETAEAGAASRTERAPGTLYPGEKRLSAAQPGFSGKVSRLDIVPSRTPSALSASELELRLIEMGFVEGANVAFLHQGLFGGDPIAFKLGDMRVALRRREADGVVVMVDGAEKNS